MEHMPRFPLFVDLSEKIIVVVGAGTIAQRRIHVLQAFCKHIRVIAPAEGADRDALWKQAKEGNIEYLCKRYEPEDLADASIVLAATNDHALNQKICEDARARNCLVNNASDQKQCDFYFPGIVRQDEIIVGITGSGSDHKRVKETRKEIEDLFTKKAESKSKV